MSEIHTITLNTALDYLIELNELTPGTLHTSDAADITPAGKGINVARTLVSLGESVDLTGFIGEENRGLFESLGSEYIRQEFISVPGQTRINVTIHEKKCHRTTHIRNPGYSVSQQHIELLMDQLSGTISRGDYIVISGSLPPGAPENLYAELIHLVHASGGIAILDSSGEALKAGMTAQPDIIAPNVTELSSIIDRDLEGEQDIRDAATAIAEIHGIELVVVSLAGDGLLGFELEPRRYHRIWLKSPVSEPIVSDVGCGDALAGGLVYAIARGDSVQEALCFASAAGTANLFKGKPGLIDPEQLYAYRGQLEYKASRKSD